MHKKVQDIKHKYIRIITNSVSVHSESNTSYLDLLVLCS